MQRQLRYIKYKVARRISLEHGDMSLSLPAAWQRKMTKNSKAHKADLHNYMREYMRRRRAAKAALTGERIRHERIRRRARPAPKA